MFVYPKRYEVIVVGAGHAGVEAALAAARMGCQALLLTMNLDTIGQMSCNPAIGGLAKGHLAREIDALGGEMGKNTDLTGIQFRMLNTKKGPAVWAPRAQCDKKAYQFRLKWVCERQPGLDCKQSHTVKILFANGKVYGVESDLGVQFHGSAVVLTTGTFLRGLMHVGQAKLPGGRAGESASTNLSSSLRELGLELGRLKTGTPPRLLRRSINFDRLEVQPGDEPVPFFTFWKEDLFHVEQSTSGTHNSKDAHTGQSHSVHSASNAGRCAYPPRSLLAQTGGQLPCYITYTTPKTAEIIRANLHRSPLYAGDIKGVGPRYCPSIEDKIVRFADKERHQIFLEPEGVATDEFYVNGFSTSLPFDVQVELVRTILGCEEAEIMRPAYAVEYDFVLPTQLTPTLETKVCQNLFLAGQINGTSGYEEAGAQGLLAGINAALRAHDRPPITLRRDQAYIGVLVDDLVTKGTTEPYRMFTSRAEYRLLLRQDNADARLTPLGHELGLVSRRNFETYQAKQSAIATEIQRLQSTRHEQQTLAQILRRPEVSYATLPGCDPKLSDEVAQQVEITIKYAGYADRQEMEIARFKEMESKAIPDWLDYDQVGGLRTESRQKLKSLRPKTLGQASRISGVSPADLSLVAVWIRRGSSPQPSLFESAHKK